MVHTGLLAVGSQLKLHDDELPCLPMVSATTASLPDPFADLRTSSPVLTGARQDTRTPTSWAGTYEPLPEPETAGNDLGSFDALFLNEDLLIGPLSEPIHPDIGAESTVGTATEAPPPEPQLQNPMQESVAATLGSRQESPYVDSAAEHDSSTPEVAAQRLLAGAMPHYDSGMQGLNRFLRLVRHGGNKKC